MTSTTGMKTGHYRTVFDFPQPSVMDDLEQPAVIHLLPREYATVQRAAQDNEDALVVALEAIVGPKNVERLKNTTHPTTVKVHFENMLPAWRVTRSGIDDYLPLHPVAEQDGNQTAEVEP